MKPGKTTESPRGFWQTNEIVVKLSVTSLARAVEVSINAQIPLLYAHLSTDGGAAWVPINEGLSTRAVTAIAISSEGNVHYAATEGEGVFRLGEIELDLTYLPLVLR